MPTVAQPIVRTSLILGAAAALSLAACSEVESDMDLEEAAALMVGHRIRRLPVMNGEALTGIVTLDDIAVRTGNLEIAQQMTSDVARAVFPDFYFHQRGG